MLTFDLGLDPALFRTTPDLSEVLDLHPVYQFNPCGGGTFISPRESYCVQITNPKPEIMVMPPPVVVVGPGPGPGGPSTSVPVMSTLLLCVLGLAVIGWLRRV